MLMPLSVEFPGAEGPKTPRTSRPWYMTSQTWGLASVLAFLAITTVPMALAPKPQWADLQERRLPCEVVDWRVGEKLSVLEERSGARTRAIATRMSEQRDVARRQCRTGNIDGAMEIYRLVDRALTRYVQVGTTPNMPN